MAESFEPDSSIILTILEKNDIAPMGEEEDVGATQNVSHKWKCFNNFPPHMRPRVSTDHINLVKSKSARVRSVVDMLVEGGGQTKLFKARHEAYQRLGCPPTNSPISIKCPWHADNTPSATIKFYGVPPNKLSCFIKCFTCKAATSMKYADSDYKRKQCTILILGRIG
jgi:hypothetical protein